MCTSTPVSATWCKTWTASAALPATGFSQKTGSPASTAARMSAEWASVAAAMTTPSTPAASRASGESTACAPTRSATCLVTAGTASVTTSESTTGRPVSVSAWNAPILPSPMRPRRMVGSLFVGRCFRAISWCVAVDWAGWSRSARCSVVAAEDVLVPVEHRARDDTAAVGQEKDHEVSDLVDLAELAHGQGLGSLLPPAVVGGVEGALGGVLALGLRPADVQAVDADAVPAVRVSGVAGQAGEARLGCDVRREVGLPSELGGGDDVDDVAGRLPGV